MMKKPKNIKQKARESTLSIPQLEASHCHSSEDKQCQTPTPVRTNIIVCKHGRWLCNIIAEVYEVASFKLPQIKRCSTSFLLCSVKQSRGNNRVWYSSHMSLSMRAIGSFTPSNDSTVWQCKSTHFFANKSHGIKNAQKNLTLYSEQTSCIVRYPIGIQNLRRFVKRNWLMSTRRK